MVMGSMYIQGISKVTSMFLDVDYLIGKKCKTINNESFRSFLMTLAKKLFMSSNIFDNGKQLIFFSSL